MTNPQFPNFPNMPGTVPAAPAPTQPQAPYNQGQPAQPPGMAPPAAAPAPAPAQAAAPSGFSLNDANFGVSSGQYLPDGDYVFDVGDFKLHQGFKGLSSVLEMRIVESNNPGVAPGSVYSWTKKANDTSSISGRLQRDEIKGFIAKAIDAIRPGTDAELHWNDPRGDGQPGTMGDLLVGYVYQTPSPVIGTRWFVRVWTKPNQTDRTKGISIHEFEAMAKDEVRGLGQAPAPAQGQAAPWS